MLWHFSTCLQTQLHNNWGLAIVIPQAVLQWWTIDITNVPNIPALPSNQTIVNNQSRAFSSLSGSSPCPEVSIHLPIIRTAPNQPTLHSPKLEWTSAPCIMTWEFELINRSQDTIASHCSKVHVKIHHSIISFCAVT